MIRVMLIDDELPALEELEYHLNQYEFIEIVAKIQNPYEVIDVIIEAQPDVVFMDIDMPGKNGIELGNEIKQINNQIVEVYVTAYAQFALESFATFPLDYILKPIDDKRLDKTISQIVKMIESRHKISSRRSESRSIKCFNRFAVYNNEVELKFTTRQSQEVLAYLICNYEKQVTRKELIGNIFGGYEDKKSVNLLHVTIYKIRSLLKEAGLSSCVQIKGNYSLKADEGICDYVDFVKFVNSNPYIQKDNIMKAQEIIRLYTGGFLYAEEYQWADEIRAELEIQYEKLVSLMADYYWETGEFHSYQHVLLQMIDYNPLADIGYCKLLDYYMETGKRNQFKQYYRKYENIMKEEFLAQPDIKYETFYKTIV